MNPRVSGIPGSDLIEKGLADLKVGEKSVEAFLVSIGSPRLRQLGFSIAEVISNPEHQLYDALAKKYGDAAHSRYNALIRRLVSFERSYACANG